MICAASAQRLDVVEHVTRAPAAALTGRRAGVGTLERQDGRCGTLLTRIYRAGEDQYGTKEEANHRGGMNVPAHVSPSKVGGEYMQRQAREIM